MITSCIRSLVGNMSVWQSHLNLICSKNITTPCIVSGIAKLSIWLKQGWI